MRVGDGGVAWREQRKGKVEAEEDRQGMNWRLEKSHGFFPTTVKSSRTMVNIVILSYLTQTNPLIIALILRYGVFIEISQDMISQRSIDITIKAATLF